MTNQLDNLLETITKANGLEASLYKSDSMTADYSQIWTWPRIGFEALSYAVEGDKVTLFDSVTYGAEECEFDSNCFMGASLMPKEENDATVTIMFSVGADDYVLMFDVEG